MRIHVAALATLVLCSGCGHALPPDAATSRRLVANVVLDWHRAQAAGDGEAGCRLLAETQRFAIVISRRRQAAIDGTRSPDSCVEAVTVPGFSAGALRVLLSTRVDGVRVSGERATTTAHTSAVISGLSGLSSLIGEVPAENVTLQWSSGHWRIDGRTTCGADIMTMARDLFGRPGEMREPAAPAACAT